MRFERRDSRGELARAGAERLEPRPRCGGEVPGELQLIFHILTEGPPGA